MVKNFWIDVIFGTIFIFGLMLFFGSLTTLKFFDIMDPIGDLIRDTDITDVYYSQLLDDPIADDNIVLVNIGNESRGSIAAMIDSINQHNPKVIGLDAFFDAPKEDIQGDWKLSEALGKVDNLVIATKLIYNDETDLFDSLRVSWPLFTWNAKNGYVNLVTDAREQEDIKVCRTFTPLEMFNDQKQLAFSVLLASYIDSSKTANFLENAREHEIINYRGNILDYGATKFGNKYYALDVIDIFTNSYLPEIIKDKIVVFCFLGSYLGDRQNMEDKFYTPLNENYIGKSFPDMYGGVVHSNIISMILNEDYINYLSVYQTYIIIVVFALLIITLFSWIYKKLPNWYDGITKIIQAILFIGIPWIIISILEAYQVKLELTLLIFVIALSGDGLEVYYGVFKNLLTSEGRKELFKMYKLN